jgi:hypothetical protein
MTRTLAPAAALSLALLLAGCGGAEKSATSATPSAAVTTPGSGGDNTAVCTEFRTPPTGGDDPDPMKAYGSAADWRQGLAERADGNLRTLLTASARYFREAGAASVALDTDRVEELHGQIDRTEAEIRALCGIPPE